MALLAGDFIRLRYTRFRYALPRLGDVGVYKAVYNLFVKGVPKAQPRPRMTANGHVYNPDSADSWKDEIKTAFMGCRRPTITEAVHLKVTFYLPMPKRIKKECVFEDQCVAHNVKPDLDNLEKAVLDSLTEAKIWKDDALVFKIESEKWYAAEKTGALIIIETVKEE
jgi:Holliday junction resolvase RusA-like endonuclease